jgi:acetyl-CoA carboxylase carboxyltransferase component
MRNMKVGNDYIKKHREIKEKALLGGGKERIEKQHEKGKYTARERIEKITDPGSFEETGTLAETISTDFGMDKNRFPGDGVVIGYGEIDARRVSIIASDATVLAGSGQSTHVRKLVEAITNAGRYGIPLIQLMDSSGGRVQEGFGHISFSGSTFNSHTMISGVVPQITAILGRCAGGTVYGAALTDFVIMVEGIGEMYITGPKVIKRVTGEDISFEELGGARVHNQISGCADFRVKTEDECFELIRKLLSYLPSNYFEKPPAREPKEDSPLDDEIERIVPSDPKKTYDMRDVILRIVDDQNFLEVKKEFAKNAIIGFARLGGKPVGIIANQPKIFAGSITVDSSEKTARFIRFCDAFNIPIISLVDTPGYLPGAKQEHMGIIRRGAKLLYAFCEATVPKISVVIRKAYGGALFAMGGMKEHGIDLVLAWPLAEFAVMGAEEAVEFLYKDELSHAANREEMKGKVLEEYNEKYANPYYVARRMVIHDVIEPRETRKKIIAGLKYFEGKKEARLSKKHGNMPL